MIPESITLDKWNIIFVIILFFGLLVMQFLVMSDFRERAIAETLEASKLCSEKNYVNGFYENGLVVCLNENGTKINFINPVS